jgi:hypothetical protein
MGLYDNKRLVDISTKLYGELGGESERRQKIKTVLTIGAIVAPIIAGIGIITSIIKSKKK